MAKRFKFWNLFKRVPELTLVQQKDQIRQQIYQLINDLDLIPQERVLFLAELTHSFGKSILKPGETDIPLDILARKEKENVSPGQALIMMSEDLLSWMAQLPSSQDNSRET